MTTPIQAAIEALKPDVADVLSGRERIMFENGFYKARMEALAALQAAQPVQSIDTLDERAAFEAWASDPKRAEKLPLDRWPANDGYKDTRTYIAFYGYKAGRAHIAQRAASADSPVLTVWSGAMPESNGKSNFTATLMRKGGSLMDSCCITFAVSEYPDRVRYEADCMRYLIGELEAEPCILDYDTDKHSGYAAPAPIADEVAGELDDGKCKSCVNDKCVTGEQCVACENPPSPKASAPAGDLPPLAELAKWHESTRDRLIDAAYCNGFNACRDAVIATRAAAAPAGHAEPVRARFTEILINRATGIGEGHLYFKRQPNDTRSPLRTLLDELVAAAPVAAEPAPPAPADDLAQHCGPAFAAALHKTVDMIEAGEPIVPPEGAADIPVREVLTKNDATTKGAEP